MNRHYPHSSLMAQPRIAAINLWMILSRLGLHSPRKELGVNASVWVNAAIDSLMKVENDKKQLMGNSSQPCIGVSPL